MRHDPITLPLTATALRRQGVGRAWLSLLSAVLQLAGGRAELLRHGERPWASVTFSGSRHTLALRFTGHDALEAGDAFVEALPEHEFALRGQIVADARITALDQVVLPEPAMTIEVELLLVEDA